SSTSRSTPAPDGSRGRGRPAPAGPRGRRRRPARAEAGADRGHTEAARRMKRRVVVTGLGALSPFGLGVPTLWEGVRAGKSGIGPITLFDTADFPVKIAGEVKGFDPEAHFEKKEVRHLDRVTQFAMVCAEEARKDAGLDLDATDRTRVGAVIGSG